MKQIALLWLCVVAACVKIPDQGQLPPVQETTETYITANINGFEVSLENGNGQCVLVYSQSAKWRTVNRKRIVLDMEAPCNFVHLYDRDVPQHYEYGKAPFNFKVFLIVGGPTDPEFPNIKDHFMPKGCCTSIQKILVYSDRIWVDYPAGTGGPPHCPSQPTDEVFLAT